MTYIRNKLRALFLGRIHRLPFVGALLLIKALSVGIVFTVDPLFALLHNDTIIILYLISTISVLILLTFALFARRLRDAGHDPRYSLLILLPPISFLLGIYLAFTPAKEM